MYSFDFLLDREPFADDAEQLLLMIALNDIKGFITVKSLMDIHYVLKHVTHDEEKVRSALSILLDTFWLVNSNAEDAINAYATAPNFMSAPCLSFSFVAVSLPHVHLFGVLRFQAAFVNRRHHDVDRLALGRSVDRRLACLHRLY